MAIIEIFSKRQKRNRGEIPDILTYENIPVPLKVQIVKILQEAFGTDMSFYGYNNQPMLAYKFIHETLCREYGVFALGNKRWDSDESYVLNYFIDCQDVESCLDVIELTFRYIERVIKENIGGYKESTKIDLSSDEAINELNTRFKEH